MGDHSSENYLDNLLNSVDGTGMNESEQKIQEEFEKTMRSKTESDFLREFESELEAEAYDEYITEFENELDSDQPMDRSLLSDMNEDVFQMADDDTSLDDMLSQMEQISADGFVDDAAQTMDTDDPSMGSLEDLDLAIGAFDSAMDQNEGNEEAAQDTEPLLSNESDLALEDILGTDGIEEIGEPKDGLMDEIGLDDLGNFDQVLEDMPDQEGQNDSKANKKGSFLEKLKLIFFGEDDEEDVVDLENVDVSNIEGLTEEQQQMLSDAEQKKAEKGKKKEKKKKEKKEKPKKPPKEKKKKEKAPKPKKEKPPKEKDNTPPLPKVPVFLIWFMAGSLGLLVILGTNLTSSSQGFASAKFLYDTGSYTEAYQEIKGLTIKEDDAELFGKISTMASVDSEYHSYIRYLNYGRKDLAFDSLVCAAGRYDMNLENAKTYGCEEELKQLKKKIKSELKKTFKMSISEALELYAIDDRNQYTLAVKSKLEELGINY